MHARALWGEYAHLFSGQCLEDVERLFIRRDVYRRLVEIVLRLQVAA